MSSQGVRWCWWRGPAVLSAGGAGGGGGPRGGLVMLRTRNYACVALEHVGASLRGDGFAHAITSPSLLLLLLPPPPPPRRLLRQPSLLPAPLQVKTHDTELNALYETAKETLVYLTHLNLRDMQDIMNEYLQQQSAPGGFTHNSLNRLCWVGCRAVLSHVRGVAVVVVTYVAVLKSACRHCCFFHRDGRRRRHR
jgi:hypothetical protein